MATTKAQRKLFFNLRGAKKRLGWMNRAEVEAVAEDLGVSPRDVLEMESRLSSQDMGFDPEPADDDSNYVAPATYLDDEGADPATQVEAEDWDSYSQERLRNALATLDDRSRDILASRWLSEDKSTLHQLAERYEVSAERIRQLESNAIKKLRTAMTA